MLQGDRGLKCFLLSWSGLEQLKSEGSLVEKNTGTSKGFLYIPSRSPEANRRKKKDLDVTVVEIGAMFYRCSTDVTVLEQFYSSSFYIVPNRSLCINQVLFLKRSFLWFRITVFH